MRQFILLALSAGTLAWAAPDPVAAGGPIERACRQSGRQAATLQMCQCIQAVANINLSRSEQRKAAKFFKDPHMAQEIRQSDRARDEALWLRYKSFGKQAAATCTN